MKKVYLFSLYYIIGGIIAIGVMIGVIAIDIVLIICDKDNPTIWAAYIILPIAIIIVIYCFIILGIYIFQWVIVDEKGVRGYCLFGKIMSMKWEEVKKVKVQALNYMVARDIGDIFIFIGEEGEKEQRTAVMTKKTNIVYKYSKRRAEFLRKVYPEINIEFEGMEQL